jgi:ElaB/YqjD/DUF883 family membrane-anchored ribosome-binding protein
MPDQSEVIKGQMKETRGGLADNVEKLEKKITGTVETVTGAVAAMGDTAETVKEAIQGTVTSVTDAVQNTVGAVGQAVGHTVEGVKSFFNVAEHVDRHPWLMLTGAVVIGYLGGMLLAPRSR